MAVFSTYNMLIPIPALVLVTTVTATIDEPPEGYLNCHSNDFKLFTSHGDCLEY